MKRTAGETSIGRQKAPVRAATWIVIATIALVAPACAGRRAGHVTLFPGTTIWPPAPPSASNGPGNAAASARSENKAARAPTHTADKRPARKPETTLRGSRGTDLQPTGTGGEVPGAGLSSALRADQASATSTAPGGAVHSPSGSRLRRRIIGFAAGTLVVLAAAMALQRHRRRA